MKFLDEYLGSVGAQEEQSESNIQVVKNSDIEDILKIYETWLGGYFTNSPNINYYFITSRFKDLNVSAKTIRDLSLEIKKYERHDRFDNSGQFLAFLINNSSEENFEVITAHLSTELFALCYKNTKNVVVIGNVGAGFGAQNESVITVFGNTGEKTGAHMKKGKIVITGNVGRFTGIDSKGGEIHVNGQIGDLYTTGISAPKTKIYHKGELIWPVKY